KELEHQLAAQAYALGIRLDGHAGFHFPRARRRQRARTFQFHHANPAHVDRRKAFEKTQRRCIDAELARGVENGGAFRDRNLFAVDLDRDTADGSWRRSLRHRPRRNRDSRRRGVQSRDGWLGSCCFGIAHENKLHRRSADSSALEAVWPSPQIEASRMACAISRSRASSSAVVPSGFKSTKRSSASSWRVTPTRQGTHCPQVSWRKNSEMRSR